MFEINTKTKKLNYFQPLSVTALYVYSTLYVFIYIIVMKLIN